MSFRNRFEAFWKEKFSTCSLCKSTMRVALVNLGPCWAPKLKSIHRMAVESTLTDAHLTRSTGYPLMSTIGATLKNPTRLKRSVSYMEHFSTVLKDYEMHHNYHSFTLGVTTRYPSFRNMIHTHDLQAEKLKKTPTIASEASRCLKLAFTTVRSSTLPKAAR